MSPPLGFKRVVIGLPQSVASQAAVNVVADLAELLHVELLATFVADSSLYALAGFPAARELRILDHGWQPINLAQIKQDIDHATGAARRCFAEAVGRRAIKSGFDVVTGTDVMASLIRADDIVAIIEPAHPGDKITRQFTAHLAAALTTARAVLVLPKRIARTTGPVMALASENDDTSIRMALDIAASLNERLIVVSRLGGAVPRALLADAQKRGVPVEDVADPGLGTQIDGFAISAKERLRVVSRNRLSDDVSELFATLRGVPLLVVTSLHP
jgi:hypothetical protein